MFAFSETYRALGGGFPHSMMPSGRAEQFKSHELAQKRLVFIQHADHATRVESGTLRPSQLTVATLISEPKKWSGPRR